MFKKKLLIAGTIAALSLSTGITAYAAGPEGQAPNESQQAPSMDNSQKPSDDGQAPSMDNNSQKPSDNGQAPDQTGDQKPSMDQAGAQPGRKSAEEAMKEGNPRPELPEGVTADDLDDLPEQPDGQAPDQINGQKPSTDQAGAQPGRKSDEEAMKEGNPTPELPAGVTADDAK